MVRDRHAACVSRQTVRVPEYRDRARTLLRLSDAKPEPQSRPNWSGYVAATNLTYQQANSVTAVSGSWVVPMVTGPSSGTTASCVWVGIDGDGIDGNSNVEQVGTAENVVNGRPEYFAWWEMYSIRGQPQQTITGLTVTPGDSITASVQYITSGTYAGQFYLSIVDNSRNEYFSTYETSSQTQSSLAQRSCAEWIVEATTVGGSIATLPNFGSVTFTNATAVINGVTGPINAASWQSQAMNIGSNGVTYDRTSVLTNSGTSFVVTYNSSAGAAVRAGTAPRSVPNPASPLEQPLGRVRQSPVPSFADLHGPEPQSFRASVRRSVSPSVLRKGSRSTRSGIEKFQEVSQQKRHRVPGEHTIRDGHLRSPPLTRRCRGGLSNSWFAGSPTGGKKATH